MKRQKAVSAQAGIEPSNYNSNYMIWSVVAWVVTYELSTASYSEQRVGERQEELATNNRVADMNRLVENRDGRTTSRDPAMYARNKKYEQYKNIKERRKDLVKSKRPVVTRESKHLVKLYLVLASCSRSEALIVLRRLSSTVS